MPSFSFVGIHAVDVTGGPLRQAAVDDGAFRRSVLGVLDDNTLCSMATVTLDGRAHVNTAYFARSDRLELFFLSHPRSLHCRNLVSNESIALTVFSSSQQWTEPGLGVQLFGHCRPVAGDRSDEAERAYRARFAAYDRWKAALADDDLARAYSFYGVEVAAVRLLDEKNLGDALFVRAEVVRE